MRMIMLCTGLLLASSVPTATQDLPLQVHQRVRLAVPSRDLRKHQDTFERVSGDTLVLQSLQLPLADVTRLERHEGRGFKVGNVVMCGALVAIPAAAVGLVIGGGIGALMKSDKWEDVPLDRLRVSVVPTRHGFGVGARIAL